MKIDTINNFLTTLRQNKSEIEHILPANDFDKLFTISEEKQITNDLSVCFHCLDDHDNLMQAICYYPGYRIIKIVRLALWLLKSYKKEVVKSAFIFFESALQHVAIIEEFDSQSGLLFFIQAISPLPIIGADADAEIGEEVLCLEVILHFATALKQYMNTHLHMKVQEVQKNGNALNKREFSNYHQHFSLINDAHRIGSEEAIDKKIEIIQKLMIDNFNWVPVDTLLQFRGIQLLFRIVESSCVRSIDYQVNHVDISIKIACLCLGIIEICMVHPDVINFVCNSPTAMKILMNNYEWALENNCIPKAVLKVINVCLWTPIIRINMSADVIRRNIYETMHRRVTDKLRYYNGISALFYGIVFKHILIKHLACKGLVGLVHNEEARKIITKHEIFTKGNIMTMLTEQIALDEIEIYKSFRKYSTKLIQLAIQNIKPIGLRNETSLHVENLVTKREVGFTDKKLNWKIIYDKVNLVKEMCFVNNEFQLQSSLLLRNNLLVSMRDGIVNKFHVKSGMQKNTYKCLESSITHMETNRQERLLLTSAYHMSAVWAFESDLCQKMVIPNKSYIEFSKLQDKIIGTYKYGATIYDTGTGKQLKSFEPSVPSNYDVDHATFSKYDELVLTDGILWDYRTEKEIFKFDKLQDHSNGKFHPNGNEIIFDTYVWDMRMFRLLYTLPVEDYNKIVFSPVNPAIYIISPKNKSTLLILDSKDYSIMRCMNYYPIKRKIKNLSCNTLDTQISIVTDTCVSIYDVGKITK